jgi:hypothetical protein
LRDIRAGHGFRRPAYAVPGKVLSAVAASS